jgi:hypothetical protein
LRRACSVTEVFALEATQGLRGHSAEQLRIDTAVYDGARSPKVPNTLEMVICEAH